MRLNVKNGLKRAADRGPRNALGRLTFIFPNAFDVYRRDTPAVADIVFSRGEAGVLQDPDEDSGDLTKTGKSSSLHIPHKC
jgi:hypothetical protein